MPSANVNVGKLIGGINKSLVHAGRQWSEAIHHGRGQRCGCQGAVKFIVMIEMAKEKVAISIL